MAHGGKGHGAAAAAPRRSATAPWTEERRRRWGGTWTRTWARDATQDEDWYISDGSKRGVACPNPSCGCKKNLKGYIFCRQCGTSLTGKGKKPQEASNGGLLGAPLDNQAALALEWPTLQLPATKGAKGGGKAKDKGGAKGGKGGDAASGGPNGHTASQAPLPPGPVTFMDADKAQKLADMAREAGDPVGEQRYLGLLALAQAAKPSPPTTRQRLEKYEEIQSEIQKKILLDLDRLDRWAKSRDAVLERVADLKQQLETAKREHKQAVLELQTQYATEAPRPAPKISIREICEGRLELDSILTMDDFLGTEEAKAQYELESQDMEELNKRKDELARQIQAGLSAAFKSTLDQAKAAQEAQRAQLQRLEGKKRKIEAPGEGGTAAASANGAGPAQASTPAAAAPAAAAPASDGPSFDDRLTAALEERDRRNL